jgi:hypothetical protein
MLVISPFSLALLALIGYRGELALVDSDGNEQLR